MTKFTKAQERAITEQSKTLLVSAAAGSGKTTTLIERIIRSVTREKDPIMLDRLLVVTFTKAAASELRLRISEALSEAIAQSNENEILAKQITLLPSAKISTIDSYCLDLVRANYATLGLSPSFRIADDGESILLANETMERLIDECYDSENSKICGGAKGFAKLVDDILGSGSDRSLGETMLSLMRTLSAYPKGASALYDCEAALRNYAKEDFFKCEHGKRIEKYIADFFEYYKKGYIRALDIIAADEKAVKSYDEAFRLDFDAILKVCDAVKKGYSDVRDAINSIEFKTLSRYSGEKSDDILSIVALRNEYKKAIPSAAAYVASDSITITDSLLRTADTCHALAEFLCEYEKRAEIEKKRLGICDFGDLGRYTLRLLVDENGNDTAFAVSQKKLYDAIYIDEYQDVNAVQDRIFAALSTETNRFMVGDIKQSIYAFRGGEPSIFANLRRSYPEIDNADNSNCASIFMSENFRCNKEVIGFTNMIFDSLMPLLSPDMNYTTSDSLVFKKKRESDTKIPVEIVIAESAPSNSDDKKKNFEAKFVASEIKRIVGNETLDNGTPVKYGDIAILMRSPKKKVDIYANELASLGIPVYSETNEDLLKQSEVEIILSLLEAIDNPRRDIPLCGILLSPIGGLSCDFIARIRNGNKNERLYTTLKNFADEASSDNDEKSKVTLFLHRLSEFRKMARFMSVGELVDEIYDMFSVYATLSVSSSAKRANLERLRHTAYSFAGGEARSLSEFLRYIRNIEKNDDSTLKAAIPTPSTTDAVRIMSVHQSKGLEFPVVFFSDTAKDYNMRDTYHHILYSGNAGIGIKLRDKSGFCVYDTPLRQSVALAMNNSMKEEEFRLLYVALTRAREKLYVTAEVSHPDELISDAATKSEILTVHSVRRLKNHLSIVLLGCGGKDNEFAKIRTIPYIPTVSAANSAEETVVTENSAAPDAELIDLLNERFNYNYSHKARTKIPAKLSISRLYPDILDDTILTDAIEEKKLPQIIEAPSFIAPKENDAAKKGTATHLFMQFFDFENAAESGAKAELDRLVEKRFITAEDAKLVNITEVEAFTTSTLFHEMRNAKKIFREQRFNLTLSAEDFASDLRLKEELSGETVLVQGVIDCFFYDPNGDIILVDYKTDRLPKNSPDLAREKLIAAHEKQLRYYAKAVEEICGIAPKKILIYSLCLGETVEI